VGKQHKAGLETGLVTQGAQQMITAIHDYTQDQLAVAHSRAHRLLVEAYAGTGKTATVAQRFQTLIEEGTQQDELLALSFTRSGRDALQARLNSHGIHHVEVRTMDSYAREIYKLVHGHVPRMADSDRYLEFALNDAGAHRYLSVNDLRRYSSWASNEGHISLPRDLAEIVPEALARYRYYKQRFGTVDFDDLMESVAAVAVGDFTEVVLDEAQDLKRWHLEFIEGLTRNRLTLVGDPYQSVYGFAGISPDALARVRDEWTTLTLRKSFRSKQNLLALPNDLFDLELESDDEGGTVRLHHDVKQSPTDVATRALAHDVEAILVRTQHEGKLIARALEKHGVKVGCSWGDRQGDIVVSTVHASKGLEWDRVMIRGLGIEGWRHATVNDAEEKRLLYVALTRARESLDILHFNGMPWEL
jgi:superfamily I DNA/RNA helicase